MKVVFNILILSILYNICFTFSQLLKHHKPIPASNLKSHWSASNVHWPLASGPVLTESLLPHKVQITFHTVIYSNAITFARGDTMRTRSEFENELTGFPLFWTDKIPWLFPDFSSIFFHFPVFF